MRVPNPPRAGQKSCTMGPTILSGTGAGVCRKAPMALPDSSSVLDNFQISEQIIAYFQQKLQRANRRTAQRDVTVTSCQKIARKKL